MQRRDFIKLTAGTAGGFILVQMPFLYKKAGVKFPDLVVTRGGTPQGLVKKAIDELGGMSRFVKRGDVVVVKPNISWDRVPQQAATTNPEVVAEVVRLCLEAGAKKIKIFDRTLNEASRCYKRSGIEKAAEGAGAAVQHVYDRKFKSVRFPDGELIKSWKVYDEVFEADRIINLPIAKHHNLSNVSLGMKNFMGYLGGNRGKFHRKFDIKITDLNTRIKADLTLIDAYRMLVRNGPSGGNIADVVLKKTIVAGIDPVAVDSYGVTLFGLEPERIGFLQQAHKRGLGEIDLKKLDIKSISLDV